MVQNWLFYYSQMEFVVIAKQYFSFQRNKEETEKSFRALFFIAIGFILLLWQATETRAPKRGEKKHIPRILYLLRNYNTEQNNVCIFTATGTPGVNGFGYLTKCWQIAILNVTII